MKLSLNIFTILNRLGIKKDKIREIPWFLGYHAFSVILCLIFLSILLGALLFYQYVILVETKEQEVSNGAIKFEYRAYQEILKEWGAKDRAFQGFNDTVSSNPFSATVGE